MRGSFDQNKKLSLRIAIALGVALLVVIVVVRSGFSSSSPAASVQRKQFVRNDTHCDLLVAHHDLFPSQENCGAIERECDMRCYGAMADRLYDFVFFWTNFSHPTIAQMLKDADEEVQASFNCYYPSSHMEYIEFVLHQLWRRNKKVRRVFLLSPLGLKPSFMQKKPAKYGRFVRIIDPLSIAPNVEETPKSQANAAFNLNAAFLNIQTITSISDPYVVGLSHRFFMNVEDNVFENTQWNRGLFWESSGTAQFPCAERFINSAKDLIKAKAFNKLDASEGTEITTYIPVLHRPAAWLRETFFEQLFDASRVFDFGLLVRQATTNMYRDERRRLPNHCFVCARTEVQRSRVILDMLTMPPECPFLLLCEETMRFVMASSIKNIEKGIDPIELKSPYSNARVTLKGASLFGNVLPFVSQKLRADALANPYHHGFDRVMAMLPDLDMVELGNIRDEERETTTSTSSSSSTSSSASSSPSTRSGNVLRVVEYNAERGKYWMEFAREVKRRKGSLEALRDADFWIVNEVDVGMARSANVHTLRLMAHALNLNYAYVIEFVELTHGTKAEQAVLSSDARDFWGFHGNAVMSRWPLARATVVRVRHRMEQYYTGSPHDPAERRLGGRVALFVEASVPMGRETVNVTLVSFHATTKWANDEAHIGHVMDAIRIRIDDYGNDIVIFGGDTWDFSCKRLGLYPLFHERVPVNQLSGKSPRKIQLGPRWNDDYICAGGRRFADHAVDVDPLVLPVGFKAMPEDENMVSMSDHPAVMSKITIR